MMIYTQQKKLNTVISDFKKAGKSIGFVPTMGALHNGHLSLMKKALEENDVVVVSIFVNPTQFNNPKDLEKYPRTLEADVEKIATISKDILVYSPEISDIYGTNVSSDFFDFHGLDRVMEGAFRPGHFDGVGTVVKKLFEIVTPTKAYFGQKDYQQLLIVKRMVEITQLPVEIIGCPIVRNADGLALSSRNQLLSEYMQRKATFIYKILQEVKELFITKNIIEINEYVTKAFTDDKDFELEYFTIAEADTLQTATAKEIGKRYRAFIAVYAEGVRLIDNMEL